MIKSAIIQGLREAVQAELDALLHTLSGNDEVTNVKFELSTSKASNAAPVITVLVTWEEIAE
jgi:hypothetical protein